jgi:hypothetical protein
MDVLEALVVDELVDLVAGCKGVGADRGFVVVDSVGEAGSDAGV